MFQKFIINREGVLKFGRVYLHRDMLAPGEQCTYGGGLWKIDEGRGAIVLYGGLGRHPSPALLSASLAQRRRDCAHHHKLRK